ncbi:Uncharacterized membrane protein, predicted efflux pump [Plasmopara halstedii]|uniref:Uncharacterized membrane protein, predicted efflux pump n=1 Tax=Plasmopara halstedii TaxID=4781 RepID=A0A0P1AZZ6_PLAHL|nr:Uncharacterized membrane protein, predicted efflux pump [Plasmopara halstedii]CEG47160.1 Uncharacterized membrane protein, predicted efflux pump [Plasmopara halstedii]|eukprot:XP_024583529.1 Uncharacterized membrane protein, predicted efflux pump [Plasmopara halstedii]
MNETISLMMKKKCMEEEMEEPLPTLSEEACAIWNMSWVKDACGKCASECVDERRTDDHIWLCHFTLIFITLLSIPVMISFFYVDIVLRLVTDDVEVLVLADRYARYLTPTVLPQAIYCALRQYLQSQEIMEPPAVIGVASVGVSLITNYVFIYGCGPFPALGFIGAPIAQSVSSSFQPIALVIYAFWYKGHHRKTWAGFDLTACMQWERVRTFVTLSVGMTINQALDEWVYNVISALAGTLGSITLAANSVLFSLWGLTCEPPRSRKADTLRFFTNDPIVTADINSVMPIFCCAVFLSGLHIIMSAVVEAMSMAATLVAITTAGSWLTMLPISYLLGLYWNCGLQGLWWGAICGEIVKLGLMVLTLWRIDWYEMARRAVRQSEGITIEVKPSCHTPLHTNSAICFRTSVTGKSSWSSRMAQSTRLDGSHCRLSADARRARHRDRMQRQRLAEKKNIMDKRAEAERLTRELEHAIQHFCTKLQKQTNVDAQIVKSCVISRKYELQLLDSKLKESAIKCTTLRHMQQRYLSLVLQQSIITEENRRLIKRHREWELFIRLLRAENERLPTPHTLNMDKLLVQHERGGRWVVFSQDEPAIFYQPIARKTCLELACKGYQRMQEMLRGPGAKKLYNEAFGWKVYFSTHRDDSNQLRMQHRFNKKISAIGANGDRITGDTLAKATWEIITTPKLVQTIRVFGRPGSRLCEG